MDAKTMRKVADNIRILEAAMVEKAKSGHPGGSMSGTDYVNTLYSKYIVYDPDDAKWFARDRFFLDPGHMSPMLYGVLAMCGKFSIEDLKNLRQWGSVTPGHPEVDVCRGIENGSGPLGQGHAMAVGAAIAERFIAARFGEVVSHKTYAFISDGGVQEEISQGAGRLAGYLGLSNLIMFYDSNKVQLATMVDDVTSEDTAAKYRAWNWNVIEIDGNDSDEICKALDQALKEDERPTLIIGNTVMGKGCVDADGNSFEFKCSTHGNPLSKSGASYEMTVKNLGGNPEDPWAVFEETKALYAARKEELKAIVAERRAKFDAWAKENPEDAAELQSWIDGKLPEIDYKAIAHKPNIATRASSADVLTVLGEKVKNMIVSSADLSNSDKTEAFLKKAGSVIAPDNYGGKFLQSGVAELTMATVMNGIALHGGLLCACGTFFVFSDYMKPAIRMTALMQLPVKYVWTHDSFRVGEDGPTHQPVEQEAQIRLMEELKNHYRSIITLLGEDAEREGLLKTPERVAKAMLSLTKGYHIDPHEVLRSAKFKEEYSQMVIVKDIDFFSLCEHHMLPFYGKAHVAYIPNGYITGLSKIARVVDIFSHRLQVQERMTLQIKDCIQETLNPLGVMVVVEAKHMCMQMRGVEKQNSITTTSDFTGAFNQAKTREEFMNLIQHGRV